MKNIIVVLSLMPGLASVRAQYHLSEFGVRTGPGVNVPIWHENLIPFYAANTGGFYSRYRCGKRDGWHAEVGYRVYGVMQNREYAPNFISEETPHKAQYHFGYFDMGACYKLRLHKHHKRQETAYLVGPRLNVRTHTVARSQGRSYALTNEGHRSLPMIQPGVHVSVWHRFPAGKKMAMFVVWGAEYYVLSAASTDKNIFGSSVNFTSLHFFLNLGFSFWKNA
jgi:hypothetical protein